jgi:hypothetical protein
VMRWPGMIERIGNTVDTVFNSAVRRLVFVVRAITGAAAIALALAACGQSAPPITPVAQAGSSPAQGGTATAQGSASAVIRPASGGGNSTGCPTQGLGGDSLPPLCATSSSPNQVRITPPATEASTSPPPSAAPSVTSVSPGQGSESGGDSVTIDGTGFCANPQVSFGGVAAQATDESATQIVAITPPAQPGQATIDITVACNGSVSPAVAADQFMYLPPTPSASPTAPAASS